MHIIKAYYILNLKMLNKDKLTLFWNISIPTAFMLMNKSYIHEISDMRFYWTYTIVGAYILGIGMNALRQREAGNLRTYFSIKPARMEFFLSMVLTQVTFCLISLLCVNLIATIMFGFNLMLLMVSTFKLIILSLPLCFLSFAITLWHSMNSNTANTIASISIFIFFMLIGNNQTWDRINPVVYIGNLLMMNTLGEYVIYIVLSGLFLIIGLYSIKNYSILSVERR